MTQYWQPVNNRTDHYHVKHYCYRAKGGGKCLPFTDGVIDAFRAKMTSCIATVISMGFKEIMISPHLDNAVDANRWWVGVCCAAGGARAGGRGLLLCVPGGGARRAREACGRSSPRSPPPQTHHPPTTTTTNNNQQAQLGRVRPPAKGRRLFVL